MDTQHPTPHTTPQPPPGLEPLLSIEEVATYLGIPVSTLYDWRVRGHGPRAHRFGKYLKFALSDVRDLMATQREPGPDAEPASLDRG